MVGTSRSNTPSFFCAKETLARNAPEREVVAECVRVGRDDDGLPGEECSEQEVSTVWGDSSCSSCVSCLLVRCSWIVLVIIYHKHIVCSHKSQAVKLAYIYKIFGCGFDHHIEFECLVP